MSGREPQPPLFYAVAKIGEPGLWWDDQYGWVDEDHEATLYSESERAIVPVPEGGRWIPIII